ncbi:MAG: heparinase II/III family protein [Gemmatimonadetes bacterium]|nr:heparinase II/III family protein [Gemmatimonadota bacterium]
MVTAERLAERKQAIIESRDLQVLLARLTERAAPLLARMPVIPEAKALLSVDGGVCPKDGAALAYDPWSPDEHRCPGCGQTWRSERHHRHWAKFQHLWLAERAAQLAMLAAVADHPAAGARAAEILATYGSRYWRYPNRDNVLGPSRLFFSTYLESIWLCNYLAAAMLLRSADRLDEALARAVGQVADEAANLIGEYDEGFSNRQTWNNAALAAIAVWFEDQELMERAVESRTGLAAHLMGGFRGDGMWYEGENYHLFALRGLLTGVAWARAAGIDLTADAALAERLGHALLAPARTALPDFTFPARKDARFGVSLAQPMYLEGWEVGLGMLGNGKRGRGNGELAAWLKALYALPGTIPELFESYLHPAPARPHPTPHTRQDLSWWSLLEMLPELPATTQEWKPESVLLESQGLAVLRTGGRYVSLECGPSGGGHGHPDRLHLTLHADGVHWLPDLGTGSYVSRDLFWYRSTLAHNAPRLDGQSQPSGDGVCEAFDVQGGWGWVRGRFGDVRRTVVSGPSYVVDLVELTGREDRLLELPWHVTGDADVRNRGRWTAADLQDEFADAEQFVPEAPGPVRLESSAHGARLTAHFIFEGELLRAAGPGRPGHSAEVPGGRGKRETFYVVRARGRNLRLLTVLQPAPEPHVRAVRLKGDLIEVETAKGVERHQIEGERWLVEAGGERVRLSGRRIPEVPFNPMLQLDQLERATGVALHLGGAPALDGSLDGFDTSEPLTLDLEDQYRRSEEAYSGPEDFSALAYAGWDDEALYLAVEVTKPDLCFRAADAPPLRLDNEPDDIHSDGLQVYVKDLERPDVTGFLTVPDTNSRGLRVRRAGRMAGDPPAVRGAWQPTNAGYRVTLAVAWPEWHRAHVGGQVGFDLIINEMLPGRERRAGQLAWSGGDGWVWLRGDRQDPDRIGILELVG